MKWSWKIGTFAGIAVHMHATFLLLLLWIAVSHWMQSGSLLVTAIGVAFTLSLFVCVVSARVRARPHRSPVRYRNQGHHALAYRWHCTFGTHA